MHCQTKGGWRWRQAGVVGVVGVVGLAAVACGRVSAGNVARGAVGGDLPATAVVVHEPAGGHSSTVRPGISVLLQDSIGLIRGRRVGLLTNQTGVDEHGVSDIERLRGDAARAAGVRLVTLYSPEHGIRGTEDRENLASGVDAQSGLIVHSLYTSQTIGPPDSTLRDVDVLVVDLQDIGTRTWTYVGSVIYAMRAAARRQLPIVVLDRPNPVSGSLVQGPVLDPTLANPNDPTPQRPGRAYALYPAPLRHGMTMAELARFFNATLGIGADLHVVPMSGWRRESWFDDTGLPWVRPSPNLPTLASATVYPALVAFEATNVSVGRGTPDAFQRFGAPWLKRDSVITLLAARRLPGVRFEGSDFTPQGPTDGKYGGRAVPGVRIVVTDRGLYHAGRTGAAVLWALGRTSPDSLTVRDRAFDERFGRPAMREALLRGEDPDDVVSRDDSAVEAWRRELAPYRLYR